MMNLDVHLMGSSFFLIQIHVKSLYIVETDILECKAAHSSKCLILNIKHVFSEAFADSENIG